MAVMYRVDKFVVPEGVREEFWGHVRRAHSVLREMPGFLGDSLLEQATGPGRFNVVTIVRWSSENDAAAARPAVERSHEQAHFRPAEFFERAGIEADMASYVDVGDSNRSR